MAVTAFRIYKLLLGINKIHLGEEKQVQVKCNIDVLSAKIQIKITLNENENIPLDGLSV